MLRLILIQSELVQGINNVLRTKSRNFIRYVEEQNMQIQMWDVWGEKLHNLELTEGRVHGHWGIDLWQLAMQHSLVSSQNRVPKFLPCFMVMSCLMICVHFWCPRHCHWGSPITDCRLWSCELENEHEEKLLIIISDHCDMVPSSSGTSRLQSRVHSSDGKNL